ncbi:MAG: site-specific integrase [Verrucomicrobiota bacterium]
MDFSVYDASGKRKYLSLSEGQKFVRATHILPEDRRAICLVIYFTGCRISEAINLTPFNRDESAKTLLIRSLKKRGKVSVRRVPIPDSLDKQLAHLEVKTEGKHFWNLSRSTVYRSVKRVMNSTGIEGVHATTKGLRHGFGVRCALGQIPVHIIQRWMGHADQKTTAIYLDVRDKEERDLMRRTWI